MQHNLSFIKKYGLFFVVAILLFSGGLFVGRYSYALAETKQQDVDMSAFWKAWRAIDEKYPDPSKANTDARVWGAIKGMVSSLNDPYSTFFDPEESKQFSETVEGEFVGVGMEVGVKDKILTVIAPLKGTPAERAGIRPGDKIIKIDEHAADALTVEQAVKYIRGEKGTTVKLTIYREGIKSPFEVGIVRDTINLPVVETKLRTDGVFVIQLYNFSQNSTQLFQEALQKFVASKSDKLILDLRGNPGGYLESAIDMASWFLPSGEIVVSEDFGQAHSKIKHLSKGYNTFGEKLKMVVLIDGGSASASEILAGALSEHKIATLIGEKSFGKGSVQEVVPITKDTALKITVAKWMTPNGVSISEKGLMPQIEVIPTEKDYQTKNDVQLLRAVRFLKTGK